MAKSNLSSSVVWDLSQLYSGIHDPKITKDKSEVQKLANAFTKKYKGKISNDKLTAKDLLSAIKEIEALEEKLYVYLNFASYLYSQDTKSPKVGAFYQESQEFSNKIATELLWFNLEIQGLSDKKAKELLKSKDLESYKHYLSHLRVFSPFRKSLPEEEIITKMNQTGAEAFVRFYDEKSSSEEFEYKNKKLSYPEIASIMKDDANYKNRKLASEAYSKTYKNNSKFYTFVLNTLLLDKKVSDEIRGYKYPQQSTFLGYEVEPKMVDTLANTVQKNYSLSEKYYETKSKVMGRKLYEWDRYSKLFYDKTDKKISWNQAKNIVLTSFREFDEEFANIAELFFNNGWIDAKVSSTKRGGAFCSYCVPSQNPYILMSYTGSVEDVMTLAHELGHGIHAYMSRDNTLFNFYPSTATAEIASIFGESLVFDYLYKNAKDKKEKINLLSNKIQGSFATIFRQTLFYLFEEEIHKARREKGELSTDNINNIFQTKLQVMFGKGLTLTDQHKYWWMPVLHFYHYNFYVFTYAFGEALALALYQNYKTEGTKFVQRYKKALKSGGSLSPKEITGMMGVDIGDSQFWQKGIALLENYVTEFEDLVEYTRPS